jgi:hypothetical protein
VLDEAPSSVSTGRLTIPASAGWFNSVYELEPVPNSCYSMIRHRCGETSRAAALQRDDYLSELALLDRRVQSPAGVLVDLHSWDDARNSRRPVQWISAWTPTALAPFASVQLPAAGFFESLGYLVGQQIDGNAVRYRQHDLLAPVRDLAARDVLIHFFAASHTGSTAWWTNSSGPGPEALRRVGWWLAENSSPDQYWTANACLVPTLQACRTPGLQVAPKVAGTNRLRDRTAATMIYSLRSKAYWA